MNNRKHIASCSGGKDSVATLILAAEHGEPIDEAIFSEVMFDEDTSGEVPEHRDFVYDVLKPFCEKEMGIKFTILHAEKTYDDVFHHIIVRGPHKGLARGFVWPGMCNVNRDCKIPPIEKYKKGLSSDTVTYVGIAIDEPVRLSRLDGTSKVSLLDKYRLTEKNALLNFDDWAANYGETITAIELSPEGTGYRSKTRFAKFYNLPELMSTFKMVADIQTADMLKLPVPKANFHTEVI